MGKMKKGGLVAKAEKMGEHNRQEARGKGKKAQSGKKSPIEKYAKGGIVGKVMGEPHGGGTSKGMGCAKKGGSFSGVR